MSDRKTPALSSRLTDRLLSWRDRLICDPRFHRFAARTPIFSTISRRRSAELFELATGFVHTQVLFACLKLQVFDMLQPGPLPVSEIAARSGLGVDPADRLTSAAVAIRLLERRRDGRIGLGILGASLNGFPGVRAMMHHNQAFYRDLIDPVALLRGDAPETELSRFWPYADQSARAVLSAGEARAYTDLMAQSQSFVADDVLDAYDMRGHRRLMDVGGGDGSFLRSAAARAPELQLMLIDLPPVAAIAAERFDAAGLSNRAAVHPADFQHDPLPVGADIVSLVRVAHDHDDDVVEHLFRSIHAALPPGGTLLIAEPMSGVPGAEAMADAYFGFYLMAMGAGRPRTPRTLRAMLLDAGFADTQFLATRRPLLVSAVVAKKAA